MQAIKPDSVDILNFLRQHPGLKEVQLSSATIVKNLGEECESLVVITSGRVKVFQLSDERKSLLLYSINPAETCVLTVSCLINRRPFPAIAETDTATSGYVVPIELFEEWFEKEAIWQKFIFSTLSSRLGDLLGRVEQLAFETLETRLMHWLQSHSKIEPIAVTHQQLAEELGTSREVVSRTLKKLAVSGLIRLGRGYIELITDR